MWCPTPLSSTPPPPDLLLKNFLGTVEQGEVPTYGQLFFFGAGGLEAHLELAVEDLRDDVFNPPDPPAQAIPPVCSHHPTFVTRSTAGLHPMPVRGGEIILWWGPY